MRIIAGRFRGRKLIPPDSAITRPITDRAKQSLFDVLAPEIPDSIVYDCFAGTGSMGLECLSRGAGRAVFFERDRAALQRLQTNIEALDLMEQSLIVAGDLFDPKLTPPAEAGRANLVFLDPPYRFVREQVDSLQELTERLARQHLAPDATVVFRHDGGDALELAGLTRYDQREYGRMTIELLRPRR